MNADPTGPDPELIFAEALEKDDPVDRASYLDRACARSPEIRQRVERLLAAHDRAGLFLAVPATEIGAAAGIPHGTGEEGIQSEGLARLPFEGPGSRIGPDRVSPANWRRRDGRRLYGRAGAAGSAQGRLQDHQTRHGHRPGDCPFRGRGARCSP